MFSASATYRTLHGIEGVFLAMCTPLRPVPLTRCVQVHTPSPCGGLPTPALTCARAGGGGDLSPVVDRTGYDRTRKPTSRTTARRPPSGPPKAPSFRWAE